MSEPNKKSSLGIIVAIIAIVLIIGGVYLARSNSGESQSATTANASSGEAKSGAEDQKELLEIKTWSRKDCSLTPWLVTEKLGYFAEEGVKLVYTGETQPAQQIPSILNGNNDVGDWHPNTFAVAKAGGARLIGVVGSGIEPDPEVDPKYRHMWWFVNPNSGIKSFADLKNKPGKIKFSTISKNICADFLGNLIADKYGIPRDKIEWVNMPDVQAIQALKQGLVDVAGVHPPFYKGMEDSGAVKIADSNDAGIGATAGVGYYVFNEDFVNANPEAVKRFTRAIVRGQKWANENPDKAAKLTEEAIGVPVTGVHYYNTSTKIDESNIEPWLAELEKSGVIAKGALKPSDLVTHEFE